LSFLCALIETVHAWNLSILVGDNWSAAVLVDNEALCSGFISNPARSVMPHLPGTQGSVEREKLYTLETAETYHLHCQLAYTPLPWVQLPQ